MEAPNNKIDVVYVLGSGSKWNNNEIRFSLRSLEKNLKGVRRVWVVGEKPDFLKNATHIPYPDELVNNADGNIIRKVLRVCQEKSLTSRFLFINDDHLVIKPVIADEIPPFHKGDLTRQSKEYFEKDFWRGRLWRTMNILIKKGYSALHFDCHTPIVIDKKLFPGVIEQFDYSKNIGFTMKSLYGNVVHPDGPLLRSEKMTIFRPFTLQQIRDRVSKSFLASFNDRGLSPGLKCWLLEMFPEPSRYEKISAMQDPFTEIVAWLNNSDHDYDEGVELYNKYGAGRKVKKYLAKGESKARMMKLEHKMKELLNYV